MSALMASADIPTVATKNADGWQQWGVVSKILAENV
jgi:hypothetical protein